MEDDDDYYYYYYYCSRNSLHLCGGGIISYTDPMVARGHTHTYDLPLMRAYTYPMGAKVTHAHMISH